MVRIPYSTGLRMVNGTTENEEKNGSRLQNMHDNSLKIAGWSYIIGDTALGVAKLMEKDKDGAWSALMWGAGGIISGIFGNPNAKKQLQLFEHKLGAYLKKQNIEIPNDPSTAELAKEGGVIQHITTFLYTYPSQFLNFGYAVGAGFGLKGGLKKGNPWDVASNALVLTGALAGLLIPEKKPDPDHPAEGTWEKTWEWAQEKPLRVSAWCYTLNNIPLVGSIVSKAWSREKSAIPRFMTAAAYALGNYLLSCSSTHNTHAKDAEKHKVMEALAKHSASIIAAQPPNVQEALVQQIAGYLAAQPETSLTAHEIAELMHAKLAESKAPMHHRINTSSQTGLYPTL